MKTFKEFIVEAADLPDDGYIKNVIEDNETVYILIGGTLGAGKSTWVSKYLPNVKLIDADEFAMELTGGNVSNDSLRSISTQALKIKQSAVKSSLLKKETFIEMGTSANSSSTIKKIELAKKLGFTTVFIFISTTPEEAVKRNHQRIKEGGRGVSPEKEYRIFQAYKDAKQTFKQVKSLRYLDFFHEVKE